MWYFEKIISLMSEEDKNRLKAIKAPVVVATPLEDARRNICVMPDGEIRSYFKNQAYLFSRNGGLDWNYNKGGSENSLGPAIYLPQSNKYLTVGLNNDSTYCYISEKGPSDTNFKKILISKEPIYDSFQPVVLSTGRIIACGHMREFVGYVNFYPTIMYSDDQGESWTVKSLPCTPRHEAVWPHKGVRWQNNGAEPHVCQLPDGRLCLIARTSLDYFYVYYSSDMGETWTDGEQSMFNGTLTTPFLLTLSDGRSLFFWNNTRALAELDHKTQWPPVNELVDEGLREDAFTNRDACHVAITSDGKNWLGFRELALNEHRNASDFRTKYGRQLTNDKSVHQFQAIELPYGKVMVCYGQHEACRRIAIFDVDWLYEKSRIEDWQMGMKNISTHLFVTSLSGSMLEKGFAGHCAWNRTDGALLVPDPELEGGEALQIARVIDKRLFSDVQGAVWNFPTADKGEIVMTTRISGFGVKVCLLDHWINPSDEYVGHYAVSEFELNPENLQKDKWNQVKIVFDVNGLVEVFVDDKLIFAVPIKNKPVHGISYLHLQTLATETDYQGTLIKRLQFNSKD